MADGKKLGTVYLGCTPETNQVTLSTQSTSLSKAAAAAAMLALEIVYVSDAGRVETAYWKSILRKFFVDGHEVISPTLDHDDFDLAVRTAQAEYDQHQPDVIVGSSRGGAVA